MRRIMATAQIAAMKVLPFLLMLTGCSHTYELDPQEANDPTVQLALTGVSAQFNRDGLYDGDLAADLNAYGWSYRAFEPGALPCPKGSSGCADTNFGAIRIAVVRGGGLYRDCPEIPSVLSHELAHAAFFLQHGDADSSHKNAAWPHIDRVLALESPCR